MIQGHDHIHEHTHSVSNGHDRVRSVFNHDRDHIVEPLESEQQLASFGTTEADIMEARKNQRKLKNATAFVLVFFLVEIVGGLWSGSLAIISDASHLLVDASSFILAMVANEIASRPACEKLTYGPVRAEVLSALLSTVMILALSLLLVYSAVMRIIEFSRGEGEEVNGRLMSFIALLGLLVNLTLLGVFGHDHGHHGHDHSHDHSHEDHDDREEDKGADESKKRADRKAGASHQQSRQCRDAGERSSLMQKYAVEDASIACHRDISGSGDVWVSTLSLGDEDRYGTLRDRGEDQGGEASQALREQEPGRRSKNINMEAAELHAMTDLLQSVGVLLAGLLVWYDPSLKWADPIATLVFVALVVNSTRRILERACNVLLEGVPDNISYEHLRHRLSRIEGVTDVHCLHVWSLTLGKTLVSAHVKALEPQKALAAAHLICEQMGVGHTTIQVQADHCEPDNCVHPCVSAVGTCCSSDRACSPSRLITTEEATHPALAAC